MRIAIKWGVILAASIAVWTLIIHLLGVYTYRIQYADTVDQVVLVLPVLAITMALLEQRRARDGLLPFGRGILTGTAVAAVSAPLTVATLWFYHHFVNPQWVSFVVAEAQRKLTAAGASPDAIAARVAQLQLAGTDAHQIRGGLVGTLLMGFVLSVIITLALRIQSAFQHRR
jgi:hypothetical protein